MSSSTQMLALINGTWRHWSIWIWQRNRLFTRSASLLVRLRQFSAIDQSSLHSLVRAALVSDYYFVIDIVNVHPTIQLSSANSLSTSQYFSAKSNITARIASYWIHLAFPWYGSIYGSKEARKRPNNLWPPYFLGDSFQMAVSNSIIKHVASSVLSSIDAGTSIVTSYGKVPLLKILRIRDWERWYCRR